MNDLLGGGSSNPFGDLTGGGGGGTPAWATGVADADARVEARTSDRAGAGTSRGKNDVKTGMTFEGDHVSISINAVEPPESEAEPFGRDTSAVDIASAVAAARAAEQEAAATEIPVAEVVDGGDGGDGEINGEADESEGAASASSKEMHAFMRQVAEVKKSDATLRSKLQKMRELHEQANAAVRADAVAELREKSRSEMGAISALGAATKKKLEALAQENAELIAENDGKYTAAMRSREALTVTMAKRLRATMVDFIELRQAIQEDYKKTVERRVFTVTGERPDDEELEELIDTGESEQVFEKAILEQGRGQVMDTVAEIHERHEAVKEIEQGLLALHQMFTDLATLVDQQGETIDNIEMHVSKATEYTFEAKVQVQKARKFQLSTQRYRLICLVILVCIGVAVFFIVARFTGLIG